MELGGADLPAVTAALYGNHCESIAAPIVWLLGPEWTIVHANANARAKLAAVGAWSPGEPIADDGGSSPRDPPVGADVLLWAAGIVAEAGGEVTDALRERLWPVMIPRRFELGSGAAAVAGVELFGRPDGTGMGWYATLTAREEQYRLTFEHAHEGLAGLDLDGRFLHVNPRCAELFGYPSDSLVGRRITEFHHPLNTSTFESASTIIHQSGHHTFERVMMRPDGSPWYCLVNSALIRDADGTPRQFIATYTDISERRIGEAFNQHSQQLAAIGRLAGGIAHDVNNLLAGILGYAELVRAATTDPLARVYCDRLIDTTERAGEFTSSVLSFARAGNGETTRFDAHDVVREVARFLDHVTPPRVQVRSDLHADRAVLDGDRSQIHAALLNLGLNAADAIVGDGEVVFASADAPGGRLRLAVSDTGVGIPADQLERVFEPFYTTKSSEHGTGLGLTTVRTAVQRHGGDVHVHSHLGVGTTFEFDLPVSPDDADIPPARAVRLPMSARVLVVDDDEVVRTVVAEALRREGCTVVEAEDGVAGLAAFGAVAEPFDAMVFDLRMPRMEGGELFRVVRARWPEVVCLLITGFSLDGAVDALRALGVAAVLQKPFTSAELTAVLAAALA